MKIVILLVFLVAVIKTTAGRVFGNYDLFEPMIKNMGPFTPKELELMKANHIKGIHCSGEKNTRSAYYSFKDGLLMYEVHYTIKKKRIVEDSVIYRYNQQGKLIVIKSFELSINSRGYDSLAYDGNGNVNYFLSYDMNKDEKKNEWTKFTMWHLILDKSTENQYEFIDIADTSEHHRIFFDKEFNLLKISSNNRVDSVSTNKISDTEYVRNYFVKDREDSLFIKGKEVYYRYGRVVHTRQYSMNYGCTVIGVEFFYEYNSDGNLILMYSNNHSVNLAIQKSVHIYDEKGLMKEDWEINNNNCNVYKYYYQFE